MSWQPAYGGAVLALRDRAGHIVATIDGPHPAGYLLTQFTPERVTSLHPTVDEAMAVENVHATSRLAPTAGAHPARGSSGKT